jgi:acyl-CoA thioesterase
MARSFRDGTMTPFSHLLSTIASNGPHHRVNPPDDWRQGRTLYGGISAALCLEAVIRDYPDVPPLRSAQIAFVGPASGEAAMQTQLLRRGKSAAFVACDLTSDDAVMTRALFCFGGNRDTGALAAAGPPVDLPGPDMATAFFDTDRRPVFAQHFDMRRASGPLPLSGAETADICFWARHVDPDAPGNAVSLLALADAAPPAAMAMLTSVTAISTMTWTIDILDPSYLSRSGWWLCRSTAETNADGYSAQSMAIWTETGAPVALGRQTVAIFPAKS